MEESRKRPDLLLPGSILVAALLISGALIYNVGAKSVSQGGQVVQQSNNQKSGVRLGSNIRPIDETDHIRGNPDAPVKLVEYSDLECPFCKRFHPTVQRIIDDYDGKVAWVYRHFPLDSIHPKARKEAEAAECAGEVGGNKAFWDYVDKVFEITPSNNGLDLNLLSQIAASIGLNRADFEKCLDSGKYAQHVEDDFQDAVRSGGRGTPYSVIVAENGTTFPIMGALPYASVKDVIEQALKSTQ